MPTVQELITGVREYLGNPGHDKLNIATICLHMYDQIDHLLNRLNLTDENWIINRQTLTVSPASPEYGLNPDFGRATVVETVDDGNPEFVRREVQMVHFQDFDKFQSGHSNYVYAGRNHNAEVCCFYKPDNQGVTMIRFAPLPETSCSYKIWYEVGRQAPPALASKPKLMEQFHNLLKVDTAISCSGLCGFPKEEFEQKSGSLQWNHDRFDQVFDTYIHQGYQEDAGPRRSFNGLRGNRW